MSEHPHEPTRTVEPVSAILEDSTLTQPHSSAPKVDGPVESEGSIGKCLELLGRLAEGGMGEILRGRDAALRRDLAVKVLREEFRGRPDMVRRFFDEARITGQLQHPGIVPVHELGTLPDGRPYFTMKLVKGRTLAELLNERPSPTDDLPRFLKVFEQICQTVAYAHSKHVIHRDLKPANVMVGAFGEVQIMDWGLAKVLGNPVEVEPEPAAPVHSVIESSRTGDQATQAGSILGTYAYMPPEQARGETERLDRRCDVFGLGAILCEVLTGKPPYLGTSSEAKALAQVGHVAPCLERLAVCGADPDLIELAMKCLQPRADDRPADATAVADAMTAHLHAVQERLREAELARVRAEGQAEQERARLQLAEAKAVAERKRRRLTMTLAGLVLLVALTGGAIAFGWWQAHTEFQRAVEAELDRANEMMTYADWAGAREALGRAEARLGPDYRGPLRQRIEDSRANLLMVGWLDEVHLRASQLVSGDHARRDARARYAWVFRLHDLHICEGEPATLAERIRSSPIREVLVDGLDRWFLIEKDATRRASVLAVLRLVDDDAFRKSIRDAVSRGDRRGVQTAWQGLNFDLSKRTPAQILCLALALAEVGDNPVSVLSSARWYHPRDFWTHYYLGCYLLRQQPPQPDEAMRAFQTALTIRPDCETVHINLSRILLDKKDLDGAHRHLDGRVDPTALSSYLQYHMGLDMLERKLLDSAKHLFESALVFDPNYPDPHVGIGQVLQLEGDLKGAGDSYRRALELEPDSAAAHYHYATALQAGENLDAALRHYRRSLELNAVQPAAHENIGIILEARNDPEGAIRSYQTAVALARAPRTAYSRLARALEAKGDPFEAELVLRRSAAAHNDTLAQMELGEFLERHNDLDEAEQTYRRALNLDRFNWRPAYHFARIRNLRGDPEEAQAHAFRAATSATEQRALPYNTLGISTMNQGNAASASYYFYTANWFDSQYAPPFANLGELALRQGDLQEAARCLEAAVARDPSFAEAWEKLGQVQLRLGQFTRASSSFRRAGSRAAESRRQAEAMLALTPRLPAILAREDKPEDARQMLDFGRVCFFHQRYDVAVRFFEEAIAADPKRAEDLNGELRYEAARVAAVASRASEENASRFRRLALGWLLAERKAWEQLADGTSKERTRLARKLLQWKFDPDFAGLRDAALQWLPEEERKEWRQFWTDVEALRKKALRKK